MIFSPHPDDEILGVGGLICQAQKNKSEVQVVFLTNGDSFGFALGKAYQNFLPTLKKIVRFGKLRQNESIQALKKLGVKRKNIIFLGYPDKSLEIIFNKNWNKNKPYKSPLIHQTFSPYKGNYTKNTVFSGENIMNDIIKIIKSFQPDIIISSSQFDSNSDHKTVYKFIFKAIKILNVSEIYLYTYLIHFRRFYPFKKGYFPKKILNPPIILRKYNWKYLELTQSCKRAKKEAILCFGSQFVIKRFLLSFVRQNELFLKEKK